MRDELKKRVLLFYITNRSGHHKAATAIERSLNVLDKETQVTTIDLVRYVHPYSSWMINKLYAFIIKKIPRVWGNIYDKKKVFKILNPLQKYVHYCDLSKINNIIKKLDPDVVACTQAFPCGLMASYKKRYKARYKLIGVVTDFWANRFWFDSCVDYYVVSSDWCQAGLLKSGISNDRLKKFGIPIEPEFSINYSKEEVAEQFGLAKNKPAILLMGGGSGIGPLSRVAKLLDRSSLDFQMVIVCGKNKKLYKWFSRQEFNKKVKVFPYIHQVHKLMEFSEIIVTKPGGITISEAMCKQLALLIMTPIPGQEGNNLKFLLENGLGLKANTPEKVVEHAENLLSDAELLKEFQRRSVRFSNALSGLEVGRLILDSSV